MLRRWSMINRCLSLNLPNSKSKFKSQKIKTIDLKDFEFLLFTF